MEDDYDERWNENFYSKIGGYPTFTQYEPRSEEQQKKYDFLLLQLESEWEKILWGDIGIGNFFISSEKLKNRDFSDVFYNWDCG
ncbi:MAG: DUF1963 domain-containing protein [Ruminococcus sp.]|nr:DUF1963 domain-containing protein [Ruminococcus sp.]